MRHFILFGIFVLLLIGCKQHENLKSSFEPFEFSYSNTFTTSFSMRFTGGDTVYIVQYFPEPSQTFRSLLTLSQRRSIDSFFKTIEFRKLDTLYYQAYEDGDGYQFHINQEAHPKTILVHSDSVPENLKRFAYWLAKMKESLSLSPVDTTIQFTNVGFFQPPPAPPPVNDAH